MTSLLGSVLVIIGMYSLLWGKSKEAKEMECHVKQSQATGGGEECNSAPQVIRITINSRDS